MFEFAFQSLPDVSRLLMADEDWKRIKDNIAALLLAQRFEVFREKVDGDGKKWEPLSPTTIRRRKNRTENDQLIDTGVLRQSFTSAQGAGNSHREVEITDEHVALRTNAEYAAIQNFGGTITIPEHVREVKHRRVQGGGVRFASEAFARKNPDQITHVKSVRMPAHSVRIPARPFDEFREKDELEIKELILKQVGEKAGVL